MANTSIEEWTTPESLALIRGWCREGYTDVMLAERIGIHVQTLMKWKNKSEELREAMKQGKEVADYMVENALFKAAIGHEYTETKTYISGQNDKNGQRQVRVEKTVKYFPPNVTAIAIWLNNRKPDDWKRNRDASIELTDDEAHVTVNIIKNSEVKKKEQEEMERRKREGIKTETVDEDEYRDYQEGYKEDKGEEEELAEKGKKIGIEEEQQQFPEYVEEGYEWTEEDEWDE